MNLLLNDPAFLSVAAGAAPLLLDTYTGAAAAYSLRQLRTGVTNVVRVRRSSDNTEQDFTATQVTDGTLTTFCGAGDGFVRTWYDQSGNSRNLEQATTANQPRIVASGLLITKGTRPAIDFDGVTDRLINSTLTLTQPVTHVIAGSRDDASGSADVFFDSLNNTQHVFYNKGTYEPPNQNWTINAGNPSPVNTNYSVSTNLFLASVLFSGASSSLRMDGAVRITGDTSTNSLSGLSIGNLRGNPTPVTSGYVLDGKVSEYIIYGSDQFSVIAAIEANINAYYGIY